MREQIAQAMAARWRPSGSRVLALLAGAVLAGCNSGSGTQVDATLGSASPSDGRQAAQQQAEVQDPRAYCPRTVLRAGTETYNIYPDRMKPDDPDARNKLRYRATITDVVRECNYSGDILAMKVGVAGRLLSGPSGETGRFTMPIRVAVTQGDSVLYSKLHDVEAEIPAGRTNNTFAFVDAEVTFPKPERENILIYVGYDPQRVDVPGTQSRGNAPRQRVN